MKYLNLILLAAPFLVQCGLIQRHPESGYYHSNFEQQSPSPLIVVQDGPTEATPTTEAEYNDLAHVERLERELTNPEELAQYRRYRHLLPDPREKIEFLTLPNVWARKRWIEAHKIDGRSPASIEPFQELIETEDIALGMDQYSVKASWGEPETVEVSGHPVHGNERWQYTEYVKSPEGYRKEVRLVYFEGGRVAGWDTKEQ